MILKPHSLKVPLKLSQKRIPCQILHREPDPSIPLWASVMVMAKQASGQLQLHYLNGCKCLASPLWASVFSYVSERATTSQVWMKILDKGKALHAEPAYDKQQLLPPWSWSSLLRTINPKTSVFHSSCTSESPWHFFSLVTNVQMLSSMILIHWSWVGPRESVHFL